jgi:hypothetical protein
MPLATVNNPAAVGVESPLAPLSNGGNNGGNNKTTRPFRGMLCKLARVDLVSRFNGWVVARCSTCRAWPIIRRSHDRATRSIRTICRIWATHTAQTARSLRNIVALKLGGINLIYPSYQHLPLIFGRLALLQESKHPCFTKTANKLTSFCLIPFHRTAALILSQSILGLPDWQYCPFVPVRFFSICSSLLFTAKK